MGVLRSLAAAALLAPVACYEPELASCAVRCTSSADCAPGQTCGAGGLCAAPDLACSPAGGDAAIGDAPGAGQQPDAGARVQLRVRVSDHGRVHVDGVGLCDSEGWQDGDCRFGVVPGVPLTLRAIPHAGYQFDQWTSTACSAAGPTCMLTPVAATTEARVRFMRVDADDDARLAGGER
ncbi:MAG TPA: hypothetical protein VK932_27980 [Kofleriaceae bacterium]|nr:hypothetical protein [Kofleriaceae bacterium]